MVRIVTTVLLSVIIFGFLQIDTVLLTAVNSQALEIQ
jgi:hypothetical protein